MEQGKYKRIHDLCISVWSSQGVVPRNSLHSMYNISHENILIIFFYTITCFTVVKLYLGTEDT